MRLLGLAAAVLAVGRHSMLRNCGYSGQRLMGILSGGPKGSPAFDAAMSTLTADFAITLP
jgi:hypothetical protein